MIYRQAVGLAYQHSLHFSPFWWGTSFNTSKYGIGLSLLYVPGLLLLSGLKGAIPVQHGQVYDFGLFYHDPLYALSGAPVHVVVTAATAYLVGRFLTALKFSRPIALAGMLLYALGSPAIIYMRGDWAQPLLTLCWMAALLSAFVYRRSGRRGLLIACGAAVCYGVLTRPVEGSLVVPVVAYFVWPRGLRPDRLAMMGLLGAGAGYALGVALTLLINWARFGSPLNFGYGGESWTTPLSTGLSGSLISPARGIVWQFPAIALSVLGAWSLAQREARIAMGLIALSLAQLLNVALWHDWWGGGDWGLRLYIPALAPLAILAAAGLSRLPARARPWVGALALIGGFAWSLPALLSDLFGGYTILADGSDGAFQLKALPLIGAWQFIHHWQALSLDDASSVDIIWLRLAPRSSNLSLIVPAIALLLGGALGWRAARLGRGQGFRAPHVDRSSVDTQVSDVEPVAESP